MSEIKDTYIQSLLAFASYADLNLGTPAIDPLKKAGMTEKQAADFAAGWAVVDRYSDASGVSATVFEEIGTGTGKRYLAIRGTESAGDINADYILALGFPSYLNPQFLRLQAQVETWLNDGTLSNGFTITGHSLGGYLAAAISTSFRSQVGETYMYNAPGVGGLVGNALDTFRAAFGFDGTALVSGITNVRGTAGFSLIAGLGTQLAPPIFIETEGNPNPIANHSIIGLTDSLAIHNLFATIDPSVSIDTVTKILKASASADTKSLESALDALRTLFVQNYEDGSANGLAATTGDREDFYTNLINLQASIKDLPGYDPNAEALEGFSIQSLAGYDGASLAEAAQDDIATRYALYKLNPFAVSGPGLYEAINTDHALDRYDPATRTGNLSEEYLTDRAEFLASKNVRDGLRDRAHDGHKERRRDDMAMLKEAA